MAHVTNHPPQMLVNGQGGGARPDLGGQVTAFLLEERIDAGYWSAHRHALDATVAVTVDAVPVGGRKVQMQMLGNLAAALRRGGFELSVETVWPGQDAPVDGGALYLHITGRTCAQPES